MNIVLYGKEFGIKKFTLGIKSFKSLNNKKENLIMLIIALEVILLSIGFLAINIAFILDDMNGVMLTLYLLPLAGAESAIALAIFIAYYPNRNTKIIN